MHHFSKMPLTQNQPRAAEQEQYWNTEEAQKLLLYGCVLWEETFVQGDSVLY